MIKIPIRDGKLTPLESSHKTLVELGSNIFIINDVKE